MSAPTGLLFNVQRYSVQDGPGLRTTVFLKGCPLACAWCHNPESQAPGPELMTLEGRCLACGTCAQACPDPGACSHCGACVAACPTGARQWLGRQVTVPELVTELLRDRMFFDQSGGGVTFSGGEPLLQPAFVTEALTVLRGRGVHTALDTCGWAPIATLLAVARQADLVLYDLKLMDDDRHRAATGIGNAPILANLAALGREHGQIRIRVPIIPGLNDDPDNLVATARFAAGVGGVTGVDLLPYHATGAAKFRRLGKDYTLEQVLPPTPERMAEAAAWFRAEGLTVALGGRP
jgi:pyruvate formate lyase activating enzyme